VNEYDYNVWCSDDGVLRLTAYELLYCENGQIAVGTNHEACVSLSVPMTDKNREVITHLLKTDDWQGQDWTDFDEWVGRDELTAGVPPKMITEFLDDLTAYVPDVAHDWTSVLDGTENDLTAPRKCRVCGIEYVVARWK
jgi:hypothetical protein